MTVSVIVPVFNERDNIEPMVKRLDAALADIQYEVIFVDDSTDDTPEEIARLKSAYPRVRHLHRTGTARWGRLGGAVVDGFRAAHGDLLVCMDGDLQHPPEEVPNLIAAAMRADLVVASRYCDGGDAGGLSNGFRKAVSRSTGLLTKAAFPKRLRGCSDPMSGFFAIRRDALDLDRLKPKGFKILLEIVARSKPMTITEIPFTFADRVAGDSHASLAEGFRFLAQLAMLRLDNKATLFSLVGASGVIPNLAVLWGLTTFAHMHFVPAAIIAIQVGVLWNFAGAEYLVWRDVRVGSFWRRFAKYAVVAEMDMFRLPFVILLVNLFGGHSVIASAITLVGMFVLRFTLAHRWVYGVPKVEQVVEQIVPVATPEPLTEAA